MGKILNMIAQVLGDLVVGAAIYFGIAAFFPQISNNVLVIVTLIVTSLYAENVEFKLKLFERGRNK